MGARPVQLCGPRRVRPVALLATAHQHDRPLSHHRRLRARRVDLRELHAVGGQSMGRATPSDGVPRGDRGRRLELADGTDAGAVVEAVPPCGGRVRHRRGGQQVRPPGTALWSVVAGARLGAPRTARVRDHCHRCERRDRGAHGRRSGPLPRLRRPSPRQHARERAGDVAAGLRGGSGARPLRALDLRVDDGGCASRWVQWTLHDDRDRRRVGRARALRRRRAAPRLVGVDETAEQEGLGSIERDVDRARSRRDRF